jgi:hypothetical protein
MGSWVDDQWVWDLRWRRDLFVWELNLLDNLLEILNGSPISVAVNSWCWKHDPCGLFSIKSAYMVIRQSTTDEVSFFADELLFPPKYGKRRGHPQKWRYSFDNFFKIGCQLIIISGNGVSLRISVLLRILCGLGSKSADHLFGSCNQLSPIWYAILRWLGVEWVSPRGIHECFKVFLGMGMSRENNLRWMLIWQTIVWTIWNFRNNVFFPKGTFSSECLINRVKLSSWKWFLGKNSDYLYSFYEWGMHPIFCWNWLSMSGCWAGSSWGLVDWRPLVFVLLGGWSLPLPPRGPWIFLWWWVISV